MKSEVEAEVNKMNKQTKKKKLNSSDLVVVKVVLWQLACRNKKKFTSFTRQSELDVLRHYLHIVQNAKTEVKKVNFFLFLWVHFTLFIFSNQLKKYAYSQPYTRT